MNKKVITALQKLAYDLNQPDFVNPLSPDKGHGGILSNYWDAWQKNRRTNLTKHLNGIKKDIGAPIKNRYSGLVGPDFFTIPKPLQRPLAGVAKNIKNVDQLRSKETENAAKKAVKADTEAYQWVKDNGWAKQLD